MGLPPEPDEVAAFVADTHPGAYRRLVDRVLASPHYGERWGQYWLDVAGYADSEGIQNADDVRPHAWRYRDYVIRAFNDDKPYDRFLLEQLAGDELADYEHAAEITPEMYDNLVATAFLRLAPDATYSPITGFVPDRLEMIDDEIEVFSSAVLGLTIKCARCHSHKFDPIPQRDYYRLAAAFKGALDEHDWLAPRTGGPDQPEDAVPSPAATRAGGGARGLESGRREARRPAEDSRRVGSRRTVADLHSAARQLSHAGPAGRTGRALGVDRRPHAVRGRTPPWPGSNKTGRRLALARWVTQKDHPLTARVMVNRVWKHHFGEGLVKTLDNFGKTGALPTHPELLDWLAVYFVEHGWSVKQLHRLMLILAVYRQSSQVTADVTSGSTRTDVAAVADAAAADGRRSACATRCCTWPVGWTRRPSARPTPLDGQRRRTRHRASGRQRRWRRSIYALKRRTQPITILQSFDVAGMDPNCIERRESIVAPQALHLKNNGLVRELAASLAQRIWHDAGDDPAAQVERAYRIVAGRSPTDDELEAALAGLDALTAGAVGQTRRRAAPRTCRQRTPLDSRIGARHRL